VNIASRNSKPLACIQINVAVLNASRVIEHSSNIHRQYDEFAGSFAPHKTDSNLLANRFELADEINRLDHPRNCRTLGVVRGLKKPPGPGGWPKTGA
jgi:hypothetical protein